MCLATSNLTCCSCYRMLRNAFFPRTRDFLVSRKTMQRHFFQSHPPSPFPGNCLNYNNGGILYCFESLGSTSFVIHSVNQRLLRNRPGSDSYNLLRLLAQKITKGIHSCKLPSLNRQLQQKYRKCNVGCSFSGGRISF